jgi:hypothetical protein
MSQSSKSALVTRAQNLLTGTQKHLATAGNLAFASASLTPAQVVSLLQTIIAMRQGVDAAKAVTKAKLSDEATQAPPLLRQMAEFEALVKVMFARSPDVLADFGLEPRKAAAPRTVEQKAAATEKAKATRAARHTMGKQQKKAVKGTVTTIVSPAPSPVATGPVAGAPAQGAVVAGTPHGT